MTQTKLTLTGRRYRVTDQGDGSNPVVETLVIGKTKAFWRLLLPGRLRTQVLKSYQRPA
jgi:hypothetical protein